MRWISMEGIKTIGKGALWQVTRAALYAWACLIRFIRGPTDIMVAVLPQVIRYGAEFKLGCPLVPTPYMDESM
jgi:hypothetical protein